MAECTTNIDLDHQAHPTMHCISLVAIMPVQGLVCIMTKDFRQCCTEIPSFTEILEAQPGSWP